MLPGVPKKNSFRPFNEAEVIPESAVGPEPSGSTFSPYSPRWRVLRVIYLCSNTSPARVDGYPEVSAVVHP